MSPLRPNAPNGKRGGAGSGTGGVAVVPYATTGFGSPPKCVLANWIGNVWGYVAFRFPFEVGVVRFSLSVPSVIPGWVVETGWVDGWLAGCVLAQGSPSATVQYAKFVPWW